MSPKPAIKTLSRRRRRSYFQLLLAIFVIAAPFLFLYATGYRFESLTVFTKTGGIYVGAEQADAEIYLNSELVHETGTFRRAFYVQDLKPGTYTVRVSKEGFHPWGKTLPVYEHIVTEAQAFNMPEEPLLILIPSTFTNQTANGTTTAIQPNSVYKAIVASFATTTRPAAEIDRPSAEVETVDTPSSTTVPGVLAPKGQDNLGSGTVEFRGMRLSETGGRILAQWTRDAESVPFYFCIQEGICTDEIELNTKEERAKYFDFFPGTTDLALVTLTDGVYVTELDNRSGQNIQPLYLSAGADFRIVDGGIYVKTADDTIYKVEI